MQSRIGRSFRFHPNNVGPELVFTMADSVDLISSDSIRNMKVADLKRELKARGLAATGNKNELIERLEAAAGILKDITDAQLDEPLDPSIDVNEDEVLSEDSLLLQAEGKGNNGDTFPSEDDLIATPVIKQPTPLRTNKNIIKTPVPMKKVEDPEKVVATAPAAASDSETKEAVCSKSSVAGTKCVLKTVKAPPKDMTPEERQALRAKKFNMPLTDSARLKMRMERFGPVVPGGKTTVKTTTGGMAKAGGTSIRSNVPPVDLAQLKKRAERFGQSVSTVAKSLEEKERILKRRERFGTKESEVRDTRFLFLVLPWAK